MCANLIHCANWSSVVLFATEPFQSMLLQWSFRKTGTMGTLASQAEIGVLIIRGRSAGEREYYPRKKKFEIVYAKSCNILVHFEPENGSQCRPQCFLENFNNAFLLEMTPVLLVSGTIYHGTSRLHRPKAVCSRLVSSCQPFLSRLYVVLVKWLVSLSDTIITLIV